MKTKTFLLVCLIAAVTAGYGQKIKQISGDLSQLKGQKTLNLQYSYDGLLVGDMNEVEYINQKVKKYNADEPGKGDKWKEAWVNDRKTRYQPKFEELFNKYLEEIGMVAKEGATDARYSIVIKTIMIEPGFNVGVVRRPASINVETDITETSNQGNSTSKISFTKVPGSDVMGFDFDSGWRIAEAYGKLGKAFAKYIVKNTK
jgi:hypothetical protein